MKVKVAAEPTAARAARYSGFTYVRLSCCFLRLCALQRYILTFLRIN